MVKIVFDDGLDGGQNRARAGIARASTEELPLRFAVILSLVLAVSPSFALDHPATPWQPRGYRCPRAAEAPTIDGHLDDPVWTTAAWTEPFVDIEGLARPVAPRFATRARLLWDDTALYIAAQLDEPHVWGTLTERDAIIFEDNDFEVFLDPDGDNHLYGELEINALGTVWDLLLVRPYRDGGPALGGWDLRGIETAVHVDGTLNDARDTDQGWTVEIAIPWPALRDIARDRACPPRPGDTWRLNFSRVQWEHRLENGRYVKTPVAGRGWKGEDNWVWSPQGLVAMHAPERWGFVTFVTDPEQTIADPRDAARDANELLMPLYYAQRTHREQHGRYARSLADLATLPADVGARLAAARLTLDAADATFHASLNTVDGILWTVDHEGRLTHEGPAK